MDVHSYLARIAYTGTTTPHSKTLRGLQVAHMLAVPFENLDIMPLHRALSLDEAALWHKIVVCRRGGFCYELNGLFAWLLKRLGFDVIYLNARVFNRAGSLGIDFDHLALLASTPEESSRWLADVGFGDSFMEPLEMREGEQAQGSRIYRLETTGDGYIVWQQKKGGPWQRLYYFDLTPRAFPADYEAGCLYHQRSPESSFTRSSIISQATPNGRISLEQDKLIMTRDEERRETPVSPDEWPVLLKKHFGVAL